MRRLNLLALVTLFIGAAACAHDPMADLGERTAIGELSDAAQSTGVPLNTSLSLQRERYRWAAEDWTAGRVEQVGPDFVVMTPFMGAIGTLRVLIEPQTAVFDGNSRVSADRLQPSADVRVNYRGKTGESRAVSVELLTPTQVASLQRP